MLPYSDEMRDARICEPSAHGSIAAASPGTCVSAASPKH